MDRLQPSRSAPDLTDLLDARLSEQQQRQDGLAEIDDHISGQASQKRRASELPTPAASRSTTPEDGYRDDEYSLRIRSESPEVFRRDLRTNYLQQDAREGSTFTDDGLISHGLEESQDGHVSQPNDHQLDYDIENPSSGEAKLSSPLLKPGRSPHTYRKSSISGQSLTASLWDYLLEEIRGSELDGSQELKAERVTNFFSVPMAVEKVAFQMDL